MLFSPLSTVPTSSAVNSANSWKPEKGMGVGGELRDVCGPALCVHKQVHSHSVVSGVGGLEDCGPSTVRIPHPFPLGIVTLPPPPPTPPVAPAR